MSQILVRMVMGARSILLVAFATAKTGRGRRLGRAAGKKNPRDAEHSGGLNWPASWPGELLLLFLLVALGAVRLLALLGLLLLLLTSGGLIGGAGHGPA